MSTLGAVPTAERSARLAEAKERRSNLVVALFCLAFAGWVLTDLPSSWSLALIAGAMALWRLYLAFRPSTFLDEKGRHELRERARTDLRAARRFRTLLKQDMKAHALMKRNLDTMVPQRERPAALQVIDQWERQTVTQLTDIESVIAQLMSTS